MEWCLSSHRDLSAHQARQQQVAGGAKLMVGERKRLELLDDGLNLTFKAAQRPSGGNGTGYPCICFQSARGIFDPSLIVCAVTATMGRLKQSSEPYHALSDQSAG